MNNIVTYAEEMLDSFDTHAFCAVDSLILSWISYMRLPADVPEAHSWQGVRLADLFRAEYFGTYFQGIWDMDSSKQLFTAMAASPRFRDIWVMGYVEQIDRTQEKQFAAVSFQINDKLCYIAFRGTDSTLVGWKENFNMAFQYPVPDQEEAARYLAEAARHCSGEIRVGGHSKGGNLAVYAAANSDSPLRERIARIYSHDGPGFLEEVLQSEQFISICPKIDKTLPQSSLVGMLLESQETFQIVKSTQVSFWQHDPFSWVVEEGRFHLIDSLTPDARYLDQTLNEWVRSLSVEERERFVDSLYGLVDKDSITTFAQLRSERPNGLPAIVHAASQLDADTREFLLQTVKALLSLALKNFPEMFRPGSRSQNS